MMKGIDKIFKIISFFMLPLLVVSFSSANNNFDNLTYSEKIIFLKEETNELKNKIDNFLNNQRYTISNYNAIKKEVIYDNKEYLAIRSFNKDNEESFLIVNLDTNNTKVVKKKDIKILDYYTNNFLLSDYNKTLIKLLDKKGLSNVGLKSSFQKDKNQVYLTADFCPSRKIGFEKDFFIKYIEKGQKNIGIAITSLWIEKHKDSFDWLRTKKRWGELDIVWVNHSYNHNYNFNKKLSENFLLLPETNLENEILDNEKTLLEYGEIPSIFFRFPGLISDKNIRNEIVRKYSLIYVGSNAWLAKNQKPVNGSIILIHGNKNEHSGIIKAEEFLENNNFIFGNLNDVIK